MGKDDNPSFVLQKVNTVTYENRPIPELKNPHDVILCPKQTGICGSDVHYLVHGAIGPFVVKSPMVLGHESAGVVHSVGSEVKSLKPGDRVAMEPGICCRYCEFCKRGDYNLCIEMKFAATPPYDGTLARYYVLPEDFCLKLPDHVSLEEGALLEPTSVGVHSVKLADVKPGQSVVVFGAGPVGLLAAAVAKAYGATKVIVVDIVIERLDFAKKYIATGTFNALHSKDPTENAKKIIADFDLGFGADKVIDCSGAEPSIKTGIHVLKQGGTFVQTGSGKDEVVFPISTLQAKEGTLKGSFRYKEGDYKVALDLVATGKVEVKSLISGRYKFEDAEAAYEAVKAGKGIKMLIAGPE